MFHISANIIFSMYLCSLFFLLGEFASFDFHTETYLVEISYTSTCQVFKFYSILQGANHLIQINVVSNLMNKLSTLASPNSEYISHSKCGPK